MDSSTTSVIVPLTSLLSSLIFSQTMFLVDGSDRLGDSWDDRIQESRDSSWRTSIGHVIPPSSMGMTGMTVVPLPAMTEMFLIVLTSSSV